MSGQVWTILTSQATDIGEIVPLSKQISGTINIMGWIGGSDLIVLTHVCIFILID